MRHRDDTEPCEGPVPHRLLRLAFRLAEVHMGDTDILGEWGRELREQVLKIHPEYEHEK